MADVSAGVEYKINVDGNSFLLDTKKYRLLESILETGSLTSAAKEIKVSYRTALNYIEKMESTLDVKIVSTTKGGKGGGGINPSSGTGSGIGLTCRALFFSVSSCSFFLFSMYSSLRCCTIFLISFKMICSSTFRIVAHSFKHA